MDGTKLIMAAGSHTALHSVASLCFSSMPRTHAPTHPRTHALTHAHTHSCAHTRTHTLPAAGPEQHLWSWSLLRSRPPGLIHHICFCLEFSITAGPFFCGLCISGCPQGRDGMTNIRVRAFAANTMSHRVRFSLTDNTTVIHQLS